MTPTNRMAWAIARPTPLAPTNYPQKTLLLTFANADTRARAVSSPNQDASASDTALVAAGLRDAREERSTRWLG